MATTYSRRNFLKVSALSGGGMLISFSLFNLQAEAKPLEEMVFACAAIICSANNFVHPYGDSGVEIGVNSLTGNSVVFPYTLQEEENTKFGILYSSAIRRILMVEFKLLSK